MTKLCGGSLWIALAAFVLAAGATQASGASTTLVVPIVLSSQGLGGSFNVSEMTLTNRGKSDVAVTFSYTAAFGGGGGVATDTLPAGRQKIVPDALAYLRSLSAAIVPESGDRGGTLRVTFSGIGAEGDAAITVRTMSPSGTGRAGVAYRGIPVSSTLTGTSYLCGLRQDGNDRSNVAVLNAGAAADGNVTLRLTVVSGDLASPGRYPLPDVTLGPGEFQQFSGILAMAGTGASSANVANGYVQIERVGGTASYWAYAVINDQVTSDGSIVLPVTTSTYSEVSKLTVPVIVETASLASELILANVGATEKSLQFTYVAGALQGGTASFTVDLGPSEQKIIPDLVQYLRSRSTAGIGPSGPDFVGALFANVSSGDGSGLFLGARTSTRGSGRYGVFSGAVPFGKAAETEAWLYGLQQNAETRTNLALANTGELGDGADTLRVELFDGETGSKVGTVEGAATTLAAKAFTQLGSVLATYAPGTSNAYARITRTSGDNPFVAYAVVNDGGRPGERTGDGAFVEMELGAASPAGPSSTDADGFLWGTEGNVNVLDHAALSGGVVATRDAINKTLQTRFVKLRFSMAFFSTPDGGVSYSPAYCLPSASQCNVPFDMDEVAELYRVNGWSMVPMIRHNEKEIITTDLIDRYVDFVDWFLGRYKTSASIQMIELVNSPLPSGDTWKGTLAQLVELTNKTYDRVKARYPDVAVGTPGFEYWMDDTSGSDGAFAAVADYFLDKSNGAKFDFWAFHGYAMRARVGQLMVGPYPPTRTPTANRYANVAGILRVRAAMDGNGWQARKIVDTEHDNITDPSQPITSASDSLDAAYLVQELVLKRTLESGGTPALSGALPLKMAPRGTIGEAALSSLNADGSVTAHVKAVALLWAKLRDYRHSAHVQGAFDDEAQVWVEKFVAGGGRELYVFFKPFKYQSGRKIFLDGETLTFALGLGQLPSALVLTDLDGKTTSITPQLTPNLSAENSPKFLEVTYSTSPVPDFSLSATAPPGITPGASGASTVCATRTGGHTAAISLSLLTSPQGIAGSGTIPSGAECGTLTIRVPSNVPPGPYALTLSGSDGSLPSRTAAVNVTVAVAAAQRAVYIQIQLHIEPFANSDLDSRYSDERANIPEFLSALESHGAKASVLPSHHFAQKALDSNDTILRDVEARGHQVATHTHLAKSDAASKWKWSLVIGPEVTSWLNGDGYFRSVSALKALLAPQVSRNTHITGFSQDDAQKTKLFDLTERLGYLTSAGGYAFNDYAYPHYAYHPKNGVDYKTECSDASVRQLYFHHMGPAVEDNDLDRIKNDFLATLSEAAASPGHYFVHGFAIHNSSLFVPHGGTNTVNYGRLKAILDFYDPYVQQGRAAYSTFDDVSHLISTPAAPQESPFALQEVRFNVPEEAPSLADLGAKTARLAPYGTLIWDLIETQKGVYDWTPSDRVLTAGWRTGTKLFVGVGAQNRLEGTTTPGPGGLPKDMTWYLTFLKKAVERYDGDGVDDAPGSPKIDVIQIGNEADGGQFWQDTPQNYARLLKESYKAIKGVAPSIQVAIGGVAAPWGFYSFYKPVLAELDRLKDAPGDRFFDIFDLHWSGQFRGDDDYAAIQLDKAYELGPYVSDIKADLAAIGYSDIPIYITEMSDYSDTPAGYLPHTERYHAAAVVKRYLYALSRGVSKIFWAGIIEQHNFGGDVNGYFDNVSLVNNPANSDGLSHKKLAYYTYRKMVAVLEGSDWKSIQVIRESDDVRVYQLNKNGKPVFVAWWDGQMPGATKPVTLTGLSGNSAVVTEAVPTASSGLSVTDYATAFHSETLPISGGTASFSLGESPVFVVVQ